MSAYGTVETYGKYDCIDCGERWALADLENTDAYDEIPADGEGIPPTGECPDCGGMCYEAEDKA